ncbi:MAG TPA: cupin domain-containing protein [Pyrinomonadaceae bacterium]|nr:cupin domain-containing protein [Pyrinomonadaceae bacterium]
MKKILKYMLLASAFGLCFVRLSEAQTKPDKPESNQDKGRLKIIALKAGEPGELSYDAGTLRILASSEDTNGAWSLVELKEMPGYHTNFHRHNHTDEAFYVIEGTLTVKIDDKTLDYPAGSYVLIPRGTPHAQGNRGNVPTRILLTMTPGGFEQSFLDRVELFKTVKPGDRDWRKKRDELTEKSKVDVERLAMWDLPKMN